MNRNKNTKLNPENRTLSKPTKEMYTLFKTRVTAPRPRGDLQWDLHRSRPGGGRSWTWLRLENRKLRKLLSRGRQKRETKRERGTEDRTEEREREEMKIK